MCIALSHYEKGVVPNHWHEITADTITLIKAFSHQKKNKKKTIKTHLCIFSHIITAIFTDFLQYSCVHIHIV